MPQPEGSGHHLQLLHKEGMAPLWELAAGHHTKRRGHCLRLGAILGESHKVAFPANNSPASRHPRDPCVGLHCCGCVPGQRSPWCHHQQNDAVVSSTFPSFLSVSGSVLVCSGCRDGVLQNGWLRTTRLHFLMVLEAGSPRWKGG